jgi:hypothetical protein
MAKLAMLLFSAIGLTGCAGGHAPVAVGNFVQRPQTASVTVMANDLARKLVALYPPAHTRFAIQQATPDIFGAALIASLRGKGYALEEFSRRGPVGQPARTGELPLAYVIDQPMENGFYRVTVLISDQSLSRLYQANDGSIVPAGYWVRKE